jgi:hypothetical protein
MVQSIHSVAGQERFQPQVLNFAASYRRCAFLPRRNRAWQAVPSAALVGHHLTVITRPWLVKLGSNGGKYWSFQPTRVP